MNDELKDLLSPNNSISDQLNIKNAMEKFKLKERFQRKSYNC